MVGDKTSTEIRSLDPDTKYYFKIQARNSKGYGPHSPVTVFRTRSSGGGGLSGGGSNAQVLQAGIPPIVQVSSTILSVYPHNLILSLSHTFSPIKLFRSS